MKQIAVDIQHYADEYTFLKWIRDLVDLNEKLSIQVIPDIYYTRAYFTVLWGLISEGREYAQKHKSTNHDLFLNMIAEILNEYTDDEYFMIQLYRNSASHIFLTKYSIIDKKGNPKADESTSFFYDRNGIRYQITQNEILDIVRRVTKNGVEEELFKIRKLKTCYPIIKKYSSQFIWKI